MPVGGNPRAVRGPAAEVRRQAVQPADADREVQQAVAAETRLPSAPVRGVSPVVGVLGAGLGGLGPLAVLLDAHGLLPGASTR